MTANHKQQLGRWGERVAESHLLAQGYTILERNERTPYGEIDLIANLGDTLVFIEVKTRATDVYGDPEVSVTPQKQIHLLHSIQSFLQAHPEQQGEWRVDVIAIRGEPNLA
ncbi:MAG: YraN family protein, partial [Anaerolineaceae bacterium]|nr:YraN family protein [Anaerolineaceae bacterium]